MGDRVLGDIDIIKLKLNITDDSQDDYLNLLNMQISQEVEQFVLGENVLGLKTGGAPVADLVEFHDGGFESIILRRALSDDPDVRDAVTLEQDGIELTQGTEYQIDAHPSRTVRRVNGAENFTASFTAGFRNIKVTYTAESLEAAADIARVVEEEAARAFLRGNNDSTDGGHLAISQRTPDSGESLTYLVNEFSEQNLRVLRTHRDGQRFF